MIPEAGIELSPALRAAQEKLYRLRQAQQARRRGLERPLAALPHHIANSRLKYSQLAGNSLGWESAPLTAAMRASHARQVAQAESQKSADLTWLTDLAQRHQPAPVPAEPTPPPRALIKLHPDLALGMLRQEKSAAGRIWLLLRAIDISGRGWVAVTQARALLTGKDSSLRVCGWRQLRNLLTQGEETFWHRRGERLWLRSTVKVAAALDVWHLSNRPVALPVALLTQGIGTVRAHFYASFHSGRASKQRSGLSQSMPIARETIKNLCRISRRSQRNYEKIAKVRRQHNYAVGPKAQNADTHENAWHRGLALFQLRDQKGKLGIDGTTYLAWQMPNNYFGPHVQQPRGQQKQINQKLADLSMQGMTGNDRQRVERARQRHAKRFYGSGRQAAKAYDQPANQDVYWRHLQCESSRRAQFWHCLPVKL